MPGGVGPGRGPRGGHDDTVYALAWAIYAAQLKLPRDPPLDPPLLIGWVPKW
ncbi:MAG: hypothetical protein ACP5I1_08730 [Candidatus Hinthialibacter sp.]